ncbi:MAG: hypothetical protein QNJ19_17655 [Woeseiaceae bacterium]|nr:hypothetical protein [Woeseiaceae bacterium]
MPRPRSELVSAADTPYYHVYSRCVRRAFLCGVDQYSGRSYEHRRGWIEDRLRVLSSLFSIDVCAYAVMSNHYHLVVKLNPNEARAWSDDEVLTRWTALFKGPLLVQRYRAGEALGTAEAATLKSMIAVLRTRLTSLSWFMKCLNEPIARQANAEDGCTGHFWEARFQSQALRSERALITAMAYVDLNPVRAEIAKTPEDSEYTSIRTRTQGRDTPAQVRQAVVRAANRDELLHKRVTAKCLASFADDSSVESSDSGLPIRLFDYLELVDVSGKQISEGKRGRIDPTLTPILDRLGLNNDEWFQATVNFRSHYRNGDLQLGCSA